NPAGHSPVTIAQSTGPPARLLACSPARGSRGVGRPDRPRTLPRGSEGRLHTPGGIRHTSNQYPLGYVNELDRREPFSCFWSVSTTKILPKPATSSAASPPAKPL